MITEEQVAAAADYIRDHSDKHAKAKADRIFLQEFRKSQKALLMNKCDEKTASARESYAYAHDDYIQVIEGLRIAVEDEERIKWLITAAQIKIDIWRTEQANNRRIDSSHQ